MTFTQKLIECIANYGGPIRSNELEKLTGVPGKNHSGLLSSPIMRGLVQCCEVENESGRKVREFRIGTAYTPRNLAQAMKIVPHEIDASNGRQKIRTDKEIEQATAHHQAQPEVAKNTGSAARNVSPPLSDCGAAQPPIEFTAASAQTVQELANALDRINELKQDIRGREIQIEAQNILIENLRKECLNAENTKTIIDPDDEIMDIQSYLCEGIAIQIGEDYVNVISSDGRAYSVTPHDCIDVVNYCINLEKRLVA